MNRIIILLITTLLSVPICAQTENDIKEWMQKGITAAESDNYQEAIIYLERIKDVGENINLKNEKYGDILFILANCYSKNGNPTSALDNCIKAKRIYESVLSDKHPQYIKTLGFLASYYSDCGDYVKSVEYGKKVLKCYKNEHGNPDYAVYLHNLASYYFLLGDNSKAIEYGTKAVETFKSIFGENHINYAISLGKLSQYYSEFGDYAKAIEYGIKTLELFKTTINETPTYYITSLSDLALYYSQLGDFSKAIEYGTKALELSISSLGIDDPIYVSALNNIASYYYDFGNYVSAVEYGIKAIEISKEVFGKNHPNYAMSLNNLSLYYSHLGDYHKAIEYGTSALEIYKTILGENSTKYAISLDNLAIIYASFGNKNKAIEYGTKANLIIKTLFGVAHPDYANSLSNLAGYYYDLGNYAKAIEYIRQNLSIYQSHTLQQFCNLPANQRANLWNKVSYRFTDYYPNLTFHIQSNKMTDLYDMSALFSKGLLLTTEMEMNKLILESGDEEAMRMYEGLRTLKLQLQKFYETPIPERHNITDSLSQVADRLENELIERSKVYGDFTKKLRTTWKDVQSALNDDEIAVEFLSFDVLGSDSTMVAALTLRKDDSEPKFIPLFELGQLQGVGDTEHFICPEVSNLVWDPLQKEFQGIRRIYFSPAGVLHKIGIEYLPGMETYDMYRLSTTREIIEMKSKTIPIQKDQVMAVLYGGVNYEASNSLSSDTSSEVMPDIISDNVSRQLAISRHRAFVDSLDLRGMKADYLPSTLTEVQNISSSLEKANHPAVVHIGADATETSVKSLSTHNPTILHISTHGFYYSEKKARKADRPRFLSIEDERGANIEDKALTRSGLLMAGANLSLKGENVPLDVDDGILTAQEISRLDLRGTDLVVLSACETGRGDIMQGEGVFGLQRGFKKAGVQTILMSLWKVSDSATEMLMTDFYRNLCEGKSKRESLRLAQKFVKEYKSSDGTYLFNDPHYWAGFVVLD